MKRIIDISYRTAGYSLMELLIVVVLLVVIAMSATSFLFTTLSGTGKASGVAVVKQNGDHAIGLIERGARFGASCVDNGPGNDDLIVGTITFRIVNDSGINRLAMDDGGTVTYLTSSKLRASGFDCEVLASPNTPDTVSVRFTLQLGTPGTDRVSEVAQETFETRVATRQYTR